MNLLALDPSSTRTGYALFDHDDRLVEAGYFYLVNGGRRPALERIDAMVADLVATINQAHPRQVVIELSSGKVNRGRHGGGGAGLAIYGQAIGELRRAALDRGADVVGVLENTWTRGRSKATRARELAAVYPAYAQAILNRADSGGDVGDAIGIGRWWLERAGAEGPRGQGAECQGAAS